MAPENWPIGAATSRLSTTSSPRRQSPLPGGSCAGDLTAASWIRLLVVLRLRQLSGRLIVEQADGMRALALIGGRPVHMTSTLPRETIAQTLQSSGAAAKDKIRWLSQRLSEGEDLEQSLVMLGAMTPENVIEHRRYRMRLAVVTAARERGATWRFEASPRLDVGRIHPSLLPDFEPLSVLVESSKEQVDINQVLMSLSQDGRGRLLPNDDFDQCFALFNVSKDLKSLPEALRTSQNFEDLFRLLSAEVAPLVQLLWVLDSAGLLEREGGETSPCPIEQKLEAAWTARPAFVPLMPPGTPERDATRSASSRPKSSTRTRGSRTAPVTERAQATPASDGTSTRSRKASRTRTGRTRERTRGRVSRPAVLRMVDGDHKHRMGRGPYVFLGVLEDADDETIARAASTLARRWRQAEQDDTLPEATRAKAGVLQAGVELARNLIGDAASREAYNTRRDTTGEMFITATGLKEGPPRSPPPTRGTKSRRGQNRSSSGSGGKTSLVDRARKCMADGEFRGAVTLLKQAREADPSSPEVFAALGWATWKAGGDRAAEDAEDYLRLALTFDARSTEALTALGKLYLSQSRTDHARAVLKMLVRLEPDSAWAKRKLSEVDTAAAKESGTTS